MANATEEHGAILFLAHNIGPRAAAHSLEAALRFTTKGLSDASEPNVLLDFELAPQPRTHLEARAAERLTSNASPRERRPPAGLLFLGRGDWLDVIEDDEDVYNELFGYAELLV